MTRHRHFLLLVQAGMQGCYTQVTTMRMMHDAIVLPEEAIPRDVLQAAVEWMRAKADGKNPTWLQEWEESRKNRVILVWRSGDEIGEWYTNAASVIASTHPISWVRWFDEDSPIQEMSRSDAEGFLEWAATIPGWSDIDPPIAIEEVTDEP